MVIVLSFDSTSEYKIIAGATSYPYTRLNDYCLDFMAREIQLLLVVRSYQD
jgi:hypothetical protein